MVLFLPIDNPMNSCLPCIKMFADSSHYERSVTRLRYIFDAFDYETMISSHLQGVGLSVIRSPSPSQNLTAFHGVKTYLEHFARCLNAATLHHATSGASEALGRACELMGAISHHNLRFEAGRGYGGTTYLIGRYLYCVVDSANLLWDLIPYATQLTIHRWVNRIFFPAMLHLLRHGPAIHRVLATSQLINAARFTWANTQSPPWVWAGTSESETFSRLAKWHTKAWSMLGRGAALFKNHRGVTGLPVMDLHPYDGLTLTANACLDWTRGAQLLSRHYACPRQPDNFDLVVANLIGFSEKPEDYAPINSGKFFWRVLRKLDKGSLLPQFLARDRELGDLLNVGGALYGNLGWKHSAICFHHVVDSNGAGPYPHTTLLVSSDLIHQY